MRLELPPERPLPNSEWMVERILTGGRATAARRPAARTYWLSGLVAAAVVITAAVIGWAVLVPTGRPQVGAPPETSAGATAGPSNVASPTVAPSRVSPPPTSRPISPTPGHEKSATVPPTTLPPTRPASSSTESRSSAAEPETSAATPTPSPATTPTEERSAEPPLTTTVPIGVRVQGPYLDLTASGTMTGGDVYAILVETCVRSLPPTASSDLPLSRSSWTLSTSAGTVTTDAPITDPITLPSTYPSEGRFGIGDCASGWIPFAVPPGTTVLAISYRDSLGANVTWNPNT
jgi:hypothetical protein